MCSTNESISTDTQESKNTQRQKCSLVFFVFFDGTNNNKVQVAKSRVFRGKKVLETINKLLKSGKTNDGSDFPLAKIEKLQQQGYIEEILSSGYKLNSQVTANDIRQLGREFWNDILSCHDLDALFFGYENYYGVYIDFADNVQYNLKIEENIDEKSSYTNVAILDSLFQKKDSDNIIYLPHYKEGSGTSGEEKEKNSLIGKGMGRGSQGVYAKLIAMSLDIQKDINTYSNSYDIESIDYYVFGFSRGATTARMFVHFATAELDNNKMPRNESKDIAKLTKKKMKKFHFLESLRNTRISVKFLGIYDTVASINLNLLDLNYTNNVKDNYLYSTYKAEYTLHLAAIDEFRKNFALVDIQSSLDAGTGTEIYMPGCHTDVGGGRDLAMNTKINNFLFKSLWTSNVHSKESIALKMISYDEDETKYLLKDDLGWANNNNDVTINNYDFRWANNNNDVTINNYDFPHIIIKRDILSGYSNIGLSLMVESVNSRLAGIFTTVENTPYKVPIDLKKIYTDISGKLNTKGRIFLYPSQDNYAKLRAKYLELSCDIGVVNSPSYKYLILKDGTKHNLLIRLVAIGSQDSTLQYMCDYSNVLYNEISGIE